MNHKTIILTILILFTLTACGGNPIDKLEEEASEQIAEQMLEQAGMGEDVNIEIDGDSVSYSVDDGEGGQMDVSLNESVDIDAITGMGYNIKLPAGLSNGVLQRVDDNGQEAMINATFDMTGTTPEQFLQEIHQTLLAEGFSYFDLTGAGLTEPDPTGSPVIAYTHSNGHQFSIMYDESGVILGLTQGGATDAANGGLDSAPTEGNHESGASATLPTTLDGSITLDKLAYTAGEPIVASIVINTPLADDAWLGIVPSDTPHGREVDSDAADISYVYISQAENGQITLYAPSAPGSYDVRLFNTDVESGVELHSITITVNE